MRSRVLILVVAAALLLMSAAVDAGEVSVACWRKTVNGKRVCLCTDGVYPWQQVSDFVCQFLMDR